MLSKDKEICAQISINKISKLISSSSAVVEVL